MDQNSEQQPQSQVDKIVGQLKREMAQADQGEDPNSPEVMRRTIATNIGILTGWAQLFKRGNKNEEVTELFQKGFEKMTKIFEPQELIDHADAVLDGVIQKEEKSGLKIITDDIQTYRHILHEEKK